MGHSLSVLAIASAAALAIVAASQLVTGWVSEIEQEPEDARSQWARTHWRRLAYAAVILLLAAFLLSRTFS
jgi:hypothetical protein